MITNISVDNLFPHPKNPRLDLGDLTELRDSIKESGILQNLTVIPDDVADYKKKISSKKAYKGCFSVVIGHRRLAAAKLAGLQKINCLISFMDEKTQLSTMLLENIQRSDLTAYEQAQGFKQLTLIGVNQDEIAKMTGISKSTVRRRIEMAELDANKLKTASERGAQLSDFDALSQIKDPKKRDEVLEVVGTSNFNAVLQAKINEEKRDKNRVKIEKIFDKFAVKVESSSNYDVNRYYHISIFDIKDFKQPTDASVKKYYYYSDSYSITLLTDKEVKTKSPRTKLDSNSSDSKAVIELKKTAGKLNELKEIGEKLRFEFIDKFKPKKEHHAIITKYAVLTSLEYLMEPEPEFVSSLCGLDFKNVDECSFDEIRKKCDYSFEHLLAILIYSVLECNFGCHRKDKSTYCENDKIKMLYNFIGELGYQMSDDEKAYVDGTHTLFTE
jgi:ParB family chromosome partitioning protein